VGRLALGPGREKSLLVVNAEVLIYTTGYCPYCQMAKQLLSRKKARFEEIDVEDRPDLRSWLLSASGQRTVPQVFINGQSVGGFTDISALDRKGELDRLLGEAKASAGPELPR
jgi:glutaredoxin 3